MALLADPHCCYFNIGCVSRSSIDAVFAVRVALCLLLLHPFFCAHVHVCAPAVEFQTCELPVELLLKLEDFEAGGIFESSM